MTAQSTIDALEEIVSQLRHLNETLDRVVKEPLAVRAEVMPS